MESWQDKNSSRKKEIRKKRIEIIMNYENRSKLDTGQRLNNLTITSVTVKILLPYEKVCISAWNILCHVISY
jgi:hypothetical protein